MKMLVLRKKFTIYIFRVITKVIIENSARWLVAHEVIITR